MNFSIGGVLIAGCTGVAISNSSGSSKATCPTTQAYSSPGVKPTVTATYTGDATYQARARVVADSGPAGSAPAGFAGSLFGAATRLR